MPTIMNLDELYFNAIKRGVKKYEIRVYDKKRKQLKELENIKLINRSNGRCLNICIEEIIWFKDFKSALSSTDIFNILPNVASVNEGVKLYEKFKGYKENSKKYGVVRIKLKLL